MFKDIFALFGFTIKHECITDIYIGTNNTRPCNQGGFHLGNKKGGGRQMVRRFHRSIYDELDELRASMDYLYQLALEPMDNPLVYEEETTGIRCQYMHNLNAEIAEHDDEVTVTVDTVPGTGNSKITADLINESTLVITCNQQEEKRDDDAANCPCNQRSFSLHHVIHLPVQVMKYGARLTSRNGVLDIHFKKGIVKPV